MREITAARAWGLPSHIHVAETREEIALLHERTGLGHIEWLNSLGVLGPDMHLVHSVWVSDDELDMAATSGALMVHCPTSNLYLASGVAPVRKMLDRGIPVTLGTDGAGRRRQPGHVRDGQAGRLPGEAERARPDRHDPDRGAADGDDQRRGVRWAAMI